MIRKNSCDCRSLRSRMHCTSSSDVALLLPDGDGRWVLARGGQVHAIGGTLNLAPAAWCAQQTEQICLPRAGHPRRARLSSHRGQTTCAVLYNWPEIHAEFIGTVLAVARGVCSRSRPSPMSDAVVRRESAAEYFKELVEGALAHQRIAAGELTSFYVVNLLTGFLQRPAEEDDDAPRVPAGRSARRRRCAPAHQPQADRRSTRSSCRGSSPIPSTGSSWTSTTT